MEDLGKNKRFRSWHPGETTPTVNESIKKDFNMRISCKEQFSEIFH